MVPSPRIRACNAGDGFEAFAQRFDDNLLLTEQFIEHQSDLTIFSLCDEDHALRRVLDAVTDVEHFTQGYQSV